MADLSGLLGEIEPAENYAGEASVDQVWRALGEITESVLIDVRTNAEWAYVGFPDISASNKELALVPWQIFPEMVRNPEFEGQVAEVAPERSAPLFFICRSGVRSKAAAIAMTVHGYELCYNVTAGFEGDLDNERHRGTSGGWKAAGLPWYQR